MEKIDPHMDKRPLIKTKKTHGFFLELWGRASTLAPLIPLRALMLGIDIINYLFMGHIFFCRGQGANLQLTC